MALRVTLCWPALNAAEPLIWIGGKPGSGTNQAIQDEIARSAAEPFELSIQNEIMRLRLKCETGWSSPSGKPSAFSIWSCRAFSAWDGELSGSELIRCAAQTGADSATPPSRSYAGHEGYACRSDVGTVMSRIRWTRSVWYALAGAIISIGAPTGLLVLREVYARRPVTAELMSDRLTYVLLASAMVLAFVGFLMGRQTDRLAALPEPR